MVRGALERQQIDPTVVRYVGSVVNVTLNILLVVGILGYFGIQTTTFAPSNIYPCRDGEWVLIAAPPDGLFRKLAMRMGKPELLDDERFKTQFSRADHRAEIDAIVSSCAMTFDAGQLVNLLREDNIPTGKCFTAADIMTDPHIKAREMVVNAYDERTGEVPMQGVVPKFSRTPGRISHAGAAVGTDTEAVYAKLLGLSVEDIAALRSRGVI